MTHPTRRTLLLSALLGAVSFHSWANPAGQGPPVLGLFKPVMKKFDPAEGEDQDRFVGYLEELMDIFRIESSDGLLSTPCWNACRT